MSAIAEPNGGKCFTPDSIQNLTLLSHFHHEKQLATNKSFQYSEQISLLEKLAVQIKMAESSQALTKFLSMFGENAAAARFLYKEAVPQQIHAISSVSKSLQQVRYQKKKPKRKLKLSCNLEQAMTELPHIAQALIEPDQKKPAPAKPSTSVEQKFNMAAVSNKNQTGISIAQGNYLNNISQKQSSNNEDSSQNVPTWKKIENQNTSNNFYAQAFDINGNKGGPQGMKRPGPEFNGSNFPDASSYQPLKNNVSRSGVNSHQIESAYQQMGRNQDQMSRDRMQRIIDAADGRDLDMNKVRKQFEKNNWGSLPNVPNPNANQPAKKPDCQGFVSAGYEFQQNLKKHGRNGYNNGYDNEYAYKQKQLEDFSLNRKNQQSNGFQGFNQNQQSNYGGASGYNNYNQFGGFNQNQEPEGSATDKLFNNAGRQPGLGGRRKFVPPTKGGDGYGPGSGGQSGGFHPGRSVQQHIIKGTGQNKDKQNPGDNLPEEMQDERYKNLDPRMVELIENEIMERELNITWDDIAGLEFAKKTIHEIIIWPMLRPDIFTGIRAPPRGVMFFGPPGTGKTLLGKAIAAQSKSTFMSISASTLTSKWVGEGEKMVRTMFAIAAIHQPSVVFIDEIDSLLSARNDADQEGSRRIKTEFLVQLDGANTFAGEEARILIIGATNRPDDLDEAVRRRLVKRLYIPLPNAAGRRQFMNRLVENEEKNKPSGASHIDLDSKSIDELVAMTKGYSGADLKSLSAEAAMIPLRSITDIANIQIDKIRPTQLDDFKQALSNVKATVNQDDLQKFMDWNDKFGSFPIKPEDLKD